MTSRTAFVFSQSATVVPVVCTACGANAPCVRRQGLGAEEWQTFQCSCGNVETRLRGMEPSDAAIEEAIEQRIQGGKI
jgi:hypothetical protein